MKMKEFFETIPPYQEKEIEDINLITSNGHIRGMSPEIFIHCDKCGGERYFDTSFNSVYVAQNQVVKYI
jgi:hypothetical protein